ncbi:(6-4)DNA photolyase [Podochytrium sp. JEL0797]|nr:(6-4)DNA photolyase [Podochytrium sp. JEL0797]
MKKVAFVSKRVSAEATNETTASSTSKRDSGSNEPSPNAKRLKPQNESQVTSILWLRKGLRLHDNLALAEALRGCDALIPVMILDPILLNPKNCGARPLQFFLECLEDLDQQLQIRQSRLVVLLGNPVELIPKYAKEWGASKVCFESDTGRYGAVRDHHVTSALSSLQIAVHATPGHTLYDPKDIKRIYSAGTFPQKYDSFLKKVAALTILEPLPDHSVPDALPPVPDTITGMPIPSLADLGFSEQLTPITTIGGESHALQCMDRALRDHAWVRSFEKPQTSPTVFRPPSTTNLSPYLARGCLSVRTLYSKIKKINASGKHSSPPVSLLGQLLWREFYYAASYLTPNYYNIEGNPVCRQIEWKQDEALLKAWANGATGYPWIDACMTQLRLEGWIHHLARHAVACFLTRGDLWVDWRLGRDVFDRYVTQVPPLTQLTHLHGIPRTRIRYLIDTDSALNNGNWMWVSASAYFSQYFRVYGPVSFGKKYDPKGVYVRKYLPVLQKMPDKFVYEPWNAPLEVQRKAGCVVGKDYPERIVAHEQVTKELVVRMGAAYKK